MSYPVIASNASECFEIRYMEKQSIVVLIFPTEYNDNSNIEYCENILNISLPDNITFNGEKLTLIFYNNVIAYINVTDDAKYESFTKFVNFRYSPKDNKLGCMLPIYHPDYGFLDNCNCSIATLQSPNVYFLITKTLRSRKYILSDTFISIRDLVCVPDTKPARMIPF